MTFANGNQSKNGWISYGAHSVFDPNIHLDFRLNFEL